MTLIKYLTFLFASVSVLCFNSAHAVKASDLVYHSADSLPLIGTLSHGGTVKYGRLPDSLETQVRPELWALGKNTAGMAVRFRSDTKAIGARWTSLNKFNMNHMTPTGIRGLDLYVLDDNGCWTTMGSARPSLSNKTSQSLIICDMSPRMREYMLYLSLYDGVDSLFIGIDSTATVLPPAVNSPVSYKPIIMYGTSILQGGCASRPGMCHTSILERMLNREVINLGFSGNGRLDEEIARLIAECPDPGVVVIDALPNCKAEDVEQRLFKFYSIIRQAHPQVGILFVESPVFPVMRFNNETLDTITKKNAVFKNEYDRILSTGDNHVAYFCGKDVLGDCVEGTVDNYHFTDLGFEVYARSLAPVIAGLLSR